MKQEFDFDKVQSIALQKAEETLCRCFDAEAYLVYVISRTLADKCTCGSEIIDIVAGSEVDENLQRMLQSFVNYSQQRENKLDASEDMSKICGYLMQIVAELYANADVKEKQCLRNTIDRLHKIMNR